MPIRTTHSGPTNPLARTASADSKSGDLRGETESEMRQQFESIRGRTATNEKLIRNLVPLALAGHCKNND